MPKRLAVPMLMDLLRAGAVGTRNARAWFRGNVTACALVNPPFSEWSDIGKAITENRSRVSVFLGIDRQRAYRLLWAHPDLSCRRSRGSRLRPPPCSTR